MARKILLVILAGTVLVAGCTSSPEEPLEPTDGDGNGTGTGTGGGSGAGNQTGNQTGDAGPPAAPQAVELAVSTTGQWPLNPGFDPGTLSAPAGSSVTVTLTYGDTLPGVASHNWVLEGVGGAETATITADSAAVTFTAPEPGTYLYFCSVGDHRDLGMEGTLTVT